MSEFFNIATPANSITGAQSSLDALFGGQANASDAPEGLFSSLVSFIDGNTNGPKISDLVQIGTPAQTGEAWLNLQLGDASLSLSAQALTTPMTPENMLSLAPGVVGALNIDGMADEALNGLTKNIGQALQSGIDANKGQNPLTAISNSILNIQEQASSLSQAATSTSGALTDALEEALQAPALAKLATAQKDTPNAPLTIEQAAVRDSLAAQLQRQMSSDQELAQARIDAATKPGNTQNASPNAQTNATAQNATAQNATSQNTGFAAALSSLPFVQTRLANPTTDPMLVAQNLAQPTAQQAEQATLFQPIKAAYQSPQVNLPQMAVAIARNFNAGKNNFQIRLDPAELGRVNISLSVDETGQVNAKMLVERPETLQLLQQDSRALERALSQAGLDGARANLEFSLKDHPFGGDHFANKDGQDETDQNDSSNTQNDTDNPIAIADYQGSIAPGGVSLWI